MPHAHHHAGMGHHAPVRREVIPADELPLPVPEIPSFASSTPALVARAPNPDSTSTCNDGDNCEKSTSEMTTTVLPVVLGACVPICCAIVVLFLLHRRHVKRLVREDADDKHRSLDFGLDEVEPKGKKQKLHPPMPQTAEHNHTKGLSLDIGQPYLMPPGIHGSTDSLHSLSRSMTGEDDKYRPATIFSQDTGSVRSFPRAPRDDASSLAGSTTRFGHAEEPNSGLLRNAQRMSRSSPPLYNTPDEANGHANSPQDRLAPFPGFSATPTDRGELMTAGGPMANDQSRDTRPQEPQSNHTGFQFELDDTHNSNPHQDQLNFPLPESAPSRESEHAQSSVQLPRISLPSSDATSDYEDERKSDPSIPAVNVNGPYASQHDAIPSHPPLPDLPEEPQNLDLAYDNRRDTRRLTLGLRPLPPEDPSDNPEQRANRIRSFYKEYFDESKTGRETTYYEDFGPEFYEDGGFVYDPVTGEYYDAALAPFAEPMGRRAMTPPPRAPPRFQGGGRHMATSSAGFNGFAPGPRAFSSASGRLPGARGPRKPMPPPAPLQTLPTPHMLKDDSIMTALDFAPGKNFRDQRAGRPETPIGEVRPYSPAVRAHTPLASPFDELSVIPSAHALRKSGTYTNLDFAPPPRFKNNDAGSDAGSIRSNRTGISNTHMNNIRMGNYRVSRLPSDMVGTKQDLMSTLRPNWDMRN
ncbi:hypothetical protein NUU61_009699 [Penicillium alfredii]|uniref:Uncharacterized protein n=1 Tax=Penicillium alfredii TaxID=1506179 RepID=A0A9W9JTU4_9EURO|nr:uncharacterized protein NUU61_009699 [Penicillium alfredii]KAJ5081435.1 hypothetical protein NUU61_009699 [Penicillium alfredii]